MSTNDRMRCRTCFETCQNVFSLQEQALPNTTKKSLADIIMEIAKIDTTEHADVLPKYICVKCSRLLKSTYLFVLHARHVNDRLLASIGTVAATVAATENADAGEKQVDCLVEAPIDIPDGTLQIKMESVYAEDETNLTDANVDGNVDGPCDGYDSTAKMVPDIKMEHFYNNDNVAEPSTSSNMVNTKLAKLKDPFVMIEPNWQMHHEDDMDFANDSDYHPTDNSSAEENTEEKDTTTKRICRRNKRRGRPPTTNKNVSTRGAGCFTCDVCNKTFAWKKDLHRHANSHFATPQNQCDFCGRQFIRKDKLKDHMKIHRKHQEEQQKSSSRSNDDDNSAPSFVVRHSEWNFGERLYTPTPFQRVECKLCSIDFQSIHELREHFVSHSDRQTLEIFLKDNNLMKELFPHTENIEEIQTAICGDIEQKRFTKYYAIVNEFGYEMSLSDSDATIDAEAAESQQPIEYKCELCYAKFGRKYKMFKHVRADHANDKLPHKCNVCKLEFVCTQIFDQHTRTQCRSKVKKYQCVKCPGKFMWRENLEGHKCSNRFNTSEYRAAQLSRTSNVRQCPICNKTFVKVKALQRHMDQHDADGSTHECPICRQRFLKDNLRQHLRERHEVELQRRIVCCLCGERFEKLSILRSHLQKHADGRTGIKMQEGKFFKKHLPNGCSERLAVSVAASIVADFKIENMSRYYLATDESGNELDLYDSETDTETKTASDKTGPDPTDSTTTSQTPPTYKCELCAQVFNRRKHILLHQSTAHADVKIWPHTCTQCYKPFVSMELLQYHLNRDCLNLLKNYQCKKCSARFVWEDNLQVHCKLKHIDSEQKISRQLANKLQCEVCDKVFVRAKDLTRHRRIHMPDDEKYDCPFCERKFNRKDNMHSHLRIHGAAAYETICKKELVRNKPPKKKSIDQNLCKRNGCKHIQCMICMSKHTKISDLRTHLRTHQYIVSFAQRHESISDISMLLYPDELPKSQETLIEHIIADIAAQQYDRFYSITNEVGYELSINSTETESDSDWENAVDSSSRKLYTCDLCTKTFHRKYQVYEHQMLSHEWLEAPHVCQHCQGRFVSAELLQAHCAQQCTNKQKRFVCRKCSHRFMWKQNLKTHELTMHAETEDGKKKPSRTYHCLECNRSFQMQKDLTRHMIVHQSDVSVFKCLWCQRKFYRQENLHMHIKRHGITPETLATAECWLTATNSPNGEKIIQCKVCNVQFMNIAELRRHLIYETSSSTTHHAYSSQLNYSITNKLGFELELDDSETDGESEAAEDGGVNTKPSYYCETCKLVCKRKYEMAQHQRAMHKPEQLPLKCERCIFKTVSKEILTHHMRTQCFNTEKQFQCDECSIKFMWQDNLNNHKRLLHSNGGGGGAAAATAVGVPIPKAPNPELLKPLFTTCVQQSRGKKIFQCDKCNRKYNHKESLAAHIKKMHIEPPNVPPNEQCNDGYLDAATGEKSVAKPKSTVDKKFLCPFCGRAISSSSNLIIHMRRHTGEKPFKCDFCDMAFPRSSDMQSHRRTHTGEKPHKCTVCDKAFARSYKLQAHMRIHSGERPYKCTYCEKSFTKSNDLTLHMRRHTGERPYVCGICGERFIQGTALKIHRTMRGHYEDIGPKRTILEQF